MTKGFTTLKAGKGSLEVSIDTNPVRVVGKALRAEADGKQLRKDLVSDLKQAVAPAVSAVQGKLQAIPHTSAVSSSPAMGSYLASRVKTQVKLSGRSSGVKVRIPKTPKLRGFTFAARRLNRTHWRHRVYGKDIWVEQTSPIPGYFDETLKSQQRVYRAAVIEALEKMARRIAARAK